MAKVEIYTKPFCGYCARAMQLLTQKGADFTQYDIMMSADNQRDMKARAPEARTVPQIFIDDQLIGGSDELVALEREGKLDALLGA